MKHPTQEQLLNAAVKLDDAYPAVAAWLVRMAEQQATEPVVQKRCHLCDCTGDIHSADGEWRGECPYCKPTQQPLTDEQCDAIYTALDEWSREVDAHEFGLPAIAGGGMGKGREIIRAAHGITGSKT